MSQKRTSHRYIGPYLLQGMLGHGNMGVVYRAWDERLERSVALKRLRPSGNSQDDRRQRFRREARTIARLSHSNVVRLYDFLEMEPGGEWLVMELVEGRSLETLFAAGPLDMGRFLRLVLQIADGLQAAHALDIIHRDLKAENVLINDREQVKILDFGLAKFFGETLQKEHDAAQFLTSDGLVVGTPHAMAPEQIRGQEVDARCDLFALGGLLYQGLSGVHPFAAKFPAKTLSNIYRLRPPPLSTRMPHVPKALSRLVESLLAKRPAERPADAATVQRRLARILRGLGTPAPRPDR